MSLKKVGAELVVRVDGHKRTIALPDALARFQPTGATFQDGALEVMFDGAARDGHDRWPAQPPQETASGDPSSPRPINVSGDNGR